MFGEDLYFDFDYSAVPELMPEQEKLVDTLSKSYWLSANEKRQAQDQCSSCSRHIPMVRITFPRDNDDIGIQ